jgi:DNA-binding NarL/FixJ family response regulator
LTPQQVTILSLIAQGYSNKEIGTQMFLSENTVKSYVQDLLQKMGARNRVDAAMIASKKGWI